MDYSARRIGKRAQSRSQRDIERLYLAAMEAPGKLLDLDDNDMCVFSLQGCCQTAFRRGVPALQGYLKISRFTDMYST